MNIFTVNSSDSILHMSRTWKRYGNNLSTCFNRNKLIHYYRNILKELCNVIFVKVDKQVKILVITIRKLLKIAFFLIITFKAKLSVKTAKIVWMKSDNLWHNEEYHIADWCKILILMWNYIRMKNGKLVDTFIFYTSFSQIVHPADPEDGDLFLLACAICISGLVITVLILLFCWR